MSRGRVHARALESSVVRDFHDRDRGEGRHPLLLRTDAPLWPRSRFDDRDYRRARGFPVAIIILTIARWLVVSSIPTELTNPAFSSDSIVAGRQSVAMDDGT